MNKLNIKTPYSICRIIAANMRVRRKEQKLSMAQLAKVSGVSYGSLKRFESSGEISLKSLTKIAIVLDCTNEFEQLFAQTQPQSIQEIIDGNL